LSVNPKHARVLGEDEAAGNRAAFRERLAAFGEGLKRLRLQGEPRLSQVKLASRLDVGISTYSSWERGLFAPQLEQLLALADLYGVSLDFLCGRGQDDRPGQTVRGVSWRLAWSRQLAGAGPGPEIWERLVAGEATGQVARALRINNASLQRQVQNLVLGEGLIITRVGRDQELERKVQEHFTDQAGEARLRDVRVGTLQQIELPFVRYVLLGHLAKEHFRQEVQEGNSVGLCGGFAVSRLVHAFRRGECPSGIRVFPVAVTPVFEKAPVSANSVASALAYRHFDYAVSASELPFVPEYVERTAGPQHLPPSRIAKRILDEAARVDFLYMGIGGRNTGALADDISDLQRSHQYLAEIDVDQIRKQEQYVGDIMYHLIDAAGEPLEGFREQNERLVCSIGLEGLRNLVDAGSLVVVIASGREKADVVRVAINSGYINVLITDDGLAEQLLSRAGP
jgi:DNA-binding transcriptional regulator LsrR (DeoR family)/DNA-binding XRE family transcriptional regulator